MLSWQILTIQSLPVHVLLSLLLLNLQGKPRAQDARRESEEGDPADGAEGGHDLPLPGDGDTVAVPHSAQRDHSPPERVRETGEVLIVILLDHVDHEGGEDEDEEADVERGDELLPVGVHHRPQQLPGPASPVHPHHPEDLEEPETELSNGVKLIRNWRHSYASIVIQITSYKPNI